MNAAMRVERRVERIIFNDINKINYTVPLIDVAPINNDAT